MPDIYVASPKKRIDQEAKEIINSIGDKEGKNPVASFVPLPQKVKFETQEKEEKIVLLLRRHWITNAGWILTGILMIFAPAICRVVPLIAFLPDRFKIIVLVIWYLLVLAFIFENFLIWFFNVYIITDERIVDVDFYSLAYRRISDAQIERIQDITYRTGGFLKSVFDYGDIFIQTAGGKAELEFESVPKPDKVVRVLNQLIVQEQKEKLEGRIR
jgi:uncharacterized membrane protein YdbT with pleckstrin-like domain